MNISINNFGKQNTPKALQKIGDICLTIGTLSGLAMIAPVAVPVAVLQWITFAGAMGKFITKLTGKKDDAPTDTPTN